MTYTEIIQSIANNLIGYFNEVYHSAEIVTIDGVKKPTITVKDEWIDLSPVDTAQTLYIRRSGDDDVQQELKLGSCSQAYLMRTPLRIVFFKDHADNHTEILSKMMQAVLIKGVKLNKIIQDKWKLQKEESTGQYELGPKTAYFAIDIYIYWNLIPDNCEQDFCVELPNPICKIEELV